MDHQPVFAASRQSVRICQNWEVFKRFFGRLIEDLEELGDIEAFVGGSQAALL